MFFGLGDELVGFNTLPDVEMIARLAVEMDIVLASVFEQLAATVAGLVVVPDTARWFVDGLSWPPLHFEHDSVWFNKRKTS